MNLQFGLSVLLIRCSKVLLVYIRRDRNMVVGGELSTDGLELGGKSRRAKLSTA